MRCRASGSILSGLVTAWINRPLKNSVFKDLFRRGLPWVLLTPGEFS